MTAHPRPSYPRIANCYGARVTWDSTPGDIAQWAKYDLLIGGVHLPAAGGQGDRLKDVLAELKRRNPCIIATHFASSAPYLNPGQNPEFPPAGYLLTADGRRIDGWPGTVMINLARAEVIEYMAVHSAQAKLRYGVDVFVDCMGPAFDSWACNIATGVPYTVDANGDGVADDPRELDEKWLEGKLRLARRIRELIGDHAVFMDNQGGRETAGWLNGILLEDYIDYTIDSDAPTSKTWREVLEDYLWWSGNCRHPNVTTLQASSGVKPPFLMWKNLPLAGQKEIFDKGRSLLRRMRYGLATALMGDGYWSYDLHTRARGQDWWYPEYDAGLGYPAGPAVMRPDGAWQREFDAPGLVVVNPNDEPVTMTVSRRHRCVSFGQTGTSFSVPARDGLILLAQG